MKEKNKKKKRNKIGIIIMAVGLVMVMGAIALFAFNSYSDHKAAVLSQKVIELIEDEGGTTETEDNETDPESDDMPTVTVDGIEYIGTISIPALDVNLPVQAEWSLDRLKISPCRYKGKVSDGSLIICAHNYRSHFGRFRVLNEGADIYFTDVNNHVYSYKVTEKYNLSEYDVDKMEQSSYWDLTLFTCIYSGSQRITLRCVRTENS